MRRFAIITAALAVLGMAPARAADLPQLPLKAPLQGLLGSGYTGSGFYLGMNMGGGGGQANVNTPGLAANVVDLQALIGVTVGYAITLSPTRWASFELDVDMMNLSTTGNGLPLTFNGPLDIEARAIYGFPLSDFLNKLPVQITGLGFNLPALPPFQALPPGVTAGNAHMYVFAGVDFKDVSANFGGGSNKVWLIAPEIGFGNRVQLSNGMAQDTSLFVQFDSKGMCAGAPIAGLGCGNLGTQYGGKLKFLY